MSPTFPLSPSGISSVDTNWGGFKKGGTYLLIGHAQAGRPRHLMTMVRASVEAGEHCLLISARPQNTLIARAEETGFDLPGASQAKQVRLLKSPPGKELAKLGDEGLAAALTDLAQLARTHKAGRVVMDDFSAFVQFHSFDSFAEAMRDLVQDAEAINTTFILGLGEPANDASRNLLRFIDGEVAGTVHATLDADDMAHFELVAGTEHVSMPTSPAPPVSPFTRSPPIEMPTEAEAAHPDPLPPPPGLEAPSLPPFELSIPAFDTGGKDADTSKDSPDLAGPPPVPEASAAAPQTVPPPETSGDTAWAQITPVSPSDAPFSFGELDTFLTGRAKLDPRGYFVDSAGPSAPESEPVNLEPNLEEAASAVQQAAYPDLFVPITPSNRAEDFRQALADAYAQRGTRPFLVMALRIREDDPYSDVFPAVSEGVRIGLGESGTILTGSYRLIALIPDAGADVARNVFAILKAHLKTIVPERADAALQHVNAMAVPNGEPFTTADELFAYAFEN